MAHRSKTQGSERPPKGKRVCPWCRQRVTLIRGNYPSHPNPLLPGRLCPASGDLYVAPRPRVHAAEPPTLPGLDRTTT